MSKPLIPAQRRERIQEYLAIHQIARTVDLCNLLETSEATVRRDLEWLEQKGILERTHGGAILNQRVILEQEYQHRAQHHPEEKKRIGELAASLIEEGDIVFINSGTTATQVLQHIRSDLQISVFTNNVSAVIELGEPGFHYYLIGGEFQPRSNSIAGRFATRT
jgi:DeoR family transcriptional regulator, fructose operon transcriptional repressor